MKKHTISIDYTIARLIADRMRVNLDSIALDANEHRRNAYNLRDAAHKQDISHTRRNCLLQEAKISEIRASVSDREFAELERICQELTKAGI